MTPAGQKVLAWVRESLRMRARDLAYEVLNGLLRPTTPRWERLAEERLRVEGLLAELRLWEHDVHAKPTVRRGQG